MIIYGENITINTEYVTHYEVKHYKDNVYNVICHYTSGYSSIIYQGDTVSCRGAFNDIMRALHHDERFVLLTGMSLILESSKTVFGEYSSWQIPVATDKCIKEWEK